MMIIITPIPIKHSITITAIIITIPSELISRIPNTLTGITLTISKIIPIVIRSA